MTILFLLFAVLLAGATSPADTLTAGDRQACEQHLNRTRDAVLKATENLSGPQWKFKPGADRWSILEVVEHLALAEDVLRSFIVTKLMQAPPPKAGRDFRQTDKMVLTVIADRSNKATAAPPTEPKGQWSAAEARRQFQARRAKTVEFLRQTAGLRDHALDSPIGQPMDAYQWLLFIAAHSERHTAQIREIQADPNYPAQ